ncbi:O-antigen ligase family protein [Sphingomonas sp. ASV193]|uniref:O-antigen ligase family protein n=1 Tax=Sphingomonas sp. ASV193 TaxID=3144405 RepID=UPI0032E8CBB2
MIARKIVGWIAPLFLAACLLLGGSVQWPWATAALRLAAVAIIVVTLPGEREASFRQPMRLALACGAIALVQLVPLPGGLWASLPGHGFYADHYALMGMAVPALPLSLDPDATVAAMLSLLVPIAVFTTMSLNDGPRPVRAVAAILAVALLGAVYGIVQWRSGSQQAYLYPISDWSTAPGFFANPNHMGILLIAAIPLATALASDRWRAHRRRSRRLPPLVAIAAVLLVAIMVIPLEQSFAALLLLPPVVIASALIPEWKNPRFRKVGLGAMAVLLLLGATAGVVLIGRDSPAGETSISIRSDIWQRTIRAAADFAPLGSGFGSFERTFPRYEDPAKVDLTFVNHAHNDYLEAAMEGGIPTLVLVALFLLWWGRQVRRAWAAGAGSPFARGASIAGTAILLHSIVDYPLRTPAIAAVFAACAAMVVAPLKITGATNEGDLRSTRHRVIR